MFWGVVGVVIMRGIMIGFGTSLVHHFSWVLLIFAAFLIFTGIKMVFSAEEEDSIDDSRMLAFIKKHMNVTPFLREISSLFAIKRAPCTKPGGRRRRCSWRWFTIELADVLFAVDSVPAVLSITSDTFVVYTVISLPCWVSGRCISRWRR